MDKPMNITQKVNSLFHFADVHHPMIIDFIRIFLGIAIFIKGIFFIQNSEALIEILHQSNMMGWAFILEHQVAFTYLVGGIFIAIGLLTRIAILFELLVFFGSIYCSLTQTGFFSVFSDIVFSFVIFGLLIFYLIWGSGKFSVDAYMRSHKKEG
jgi:uncharacterized membrane protein YphA (DoxX/SURF4 family)